MYFEDNELSLLLSGAEVVVFDLNGLLIDDEPIQLAATNAALQEFGVFLSKEDWIERCVGHKPKEYLPLCLGTICSDTTFIDRVLDTKEWHYRSLIANNSKGLVREGAESLIRFLIRDGRRPIALATSTTKTSAEFILSYPGLRLSGKFEFVVTGDEVSRAKPDPEIYSFVRAHFPGFDSFLVFEDSSTGLISAKAASMRCVVVPNGFTAHQDFTGADAVISDLSRTAVRSCSRGRVQSR